MTASDMITIDVKNSIAALEKAIVDAQKRGDETVIVAVSPVLICGLLEDNRVKINEVPINVSTGDFKLDQAMDAYFGDGSFSFPVIACGGSEIPVIVIRELKDTGNDSFRLSLR